MQVPGSRALLICVAILATGFLLHISIGSSQNYYPWDVAREIIRGAQDDSAINRIVWSLRLPRAIQCVLVGALLSVSGATLQSLFRNPLAEPYIVGASTGAAVGGALVFVLGLGNLVFGLMTPAAGAATGAFTLFLVMALARREGKIETPNLLLAGVVISTLLSALLSLIILSAGRDQGVVLRWLLGSMSEATFSRVGVMFFTLLIGYPLLYRLTQALNVLSISEETAQTVGIDAAKTRSVALSTSSVLTAVTVGSVGIIGFVGLVAPHIARRLVGADLRKVLPLATVTGSVIVLLADAIAQRGVQGTEFPVGIITALLGAPTLLILLRKS